MRIVIAALICLLTAACARFQCEYEINSQMFKNAQSTSTIAPIAFLAGPIGGALAGAAVASDVNPNPPLSTKTCP